MIDLHNQYGANIYEYHKLFTRKSATAIQLHQTQFRWYVMDSRFFRKLSRGSQSRCCAEYGESSHITHFCPDLHYSSRPNLQPKASHISIGNRFGWALDKLGGKLVYYQGWNCVIVLTLSKDACGKNAVLLTNVYIAKQQAIFTIVIRSSKSHSNEWFADNHILPVVRSPVNVQQLESEFKRREDTSLMSYFIFGFTEGFDTLPTKECRNLLTSDWWFDFEDEEQRISFRSVQYTPISISISISSRCGGRQMWWFNADITIDNQQAEMFLAIQQKNILANHRAGVFKAYLKFQEHASPPSTWQDRHAATFSFWIFL